MIHLEVAGSVRVNFISDKVSLFLIYGLPWILLTNR